MVESCSHELKITKVCWVKPTDSTIKLNNDGSTIDNPGSSGVGGICRDKKGDLIFAFSSPLGVCTNNQAELEAAFFGLSWCLHLGYTKVLLEMDSELSVKWINQKSSLN